MSFDPNCGSTIITNGPTDIVEVVTAGPQGVKGDTGAGVVAGGTTGQVLAKSANIDYATMWITPTDDFDPLSPGPIGTTTPNTGDFSTINVDLLRTYNSAATATDYSRMEFKTANNGNLEISPQAGGTGNLGTRVTVNAELQVEEGILLTQVTDFQDLLQWYTNGQPSLKILSSTFGAKFTCATLEVLGLQPNMAQLAYNGTLGWTVGTDVNAAADTGLSREAAGVLSVGNGTRNDTSGTIKADQFVVPSLARIFARPQDFPGATGSDGALGLSAEGRIQWSSNPSAAGSDYDLCLSPIPSSTGADALGVFNILEYQRTERAAIAVDAVELSGTARISEPVTGTVEIAADLTAGDNAAPVVLTDPAALVPDGVTGAGNVLNMVSLTQAQYDSLAAPVATTLYIITD